MVENHVLSVGNTCSILVLRAYGTHTETHITQDDVVCTRERDTVAIDRNALTRCSLTSDVEVVLKNHTRVDTDNAAHVEHDDTVRLAYGIA